MSNTAAFLAPQDTYVDEAKPTSRYSGTSMLYLNGNGATEAEAFILFTAANIPAGLVVESATLRLQAAATWAATNLTVQRVTTKPTISRLTWATKPTSTSAGQSVTATGSVAKNAFLPALDVTTIVQAWANGSPKYGFRVRSSATTIRKAHSAQATSSSRRPVLTITGYLPPPTPEPVSPANGQTIGAEFPTFTWAKQVGLFQTQTGYRVKAYSDAGLTTLVFDTDWVVSGTNAHVSTVSLGSGTTWYWTVQTRSAVGVESPVSDAVSVSRVTKPVLTILTPGASVNDALPETSWSVDVGVQTAWRVEHYDPDDPSVNVADSGWTNDASTAWAPTQTTQVQARNLEVRVSVITDLSPTYPQPGEPIESVGTQGYAYAAGATTPVSALTATPTTPQPGMHLEFTLADPDVELVFWVDGLEVERGPAADYLVSGTDYEYFDYLSAPRTERTWAVVVNDAGVNSPAVTADGTVATPYIWLLDPEEPDWWLAIADQRESGLAFTEDSEVAYIRGSNRAQLIVDTLRGYEGEVAGGVYEELPGVDGLSAQSLRDRVWHLKQHPTRVFRLVLSDQNIPVVVRNVTVELQPLRELQYGISFLAYQQGEVGWEV